MPRRTKRSRARIRLKHSDVWRTLLTDTAPFEAPIIFSNDGFYKNLSEYESKSPTLKKLIEALVLSPRKFTIPWRYNIVRDTEGVRTLSLLHPCGQVELARFYRRYDQLICEYGQRSPFSIRKPTKIGGSFFFQSDLSDKNKYKHTSVDVSQIDELLRNPASYFSYERYDRLYRFFMSNEHITLEKRFKYQLSLDVSKCFDSIYTHSIAWAVKDKSIAKDNTRAHSFGNQFDVTMQRLNHNETSGICIGPEASRIFAEIILARVDELALSRLQDNAGITHRVDFECRRYIDNYYVFANSEAVLFRAQQEIADALREYKLHLNESKTERVERPFYSPKSLVIDNVNSSIQKLWDRTMDNESPTGFSFPRRVRSHQALFGAFTREVKAACFAAGVGYDAVANYIIGAIRSKTVELADCYVEAERADDERSELLYYRQSMLLLLDIGFYFFTLHPTVASSLRLSHAIVRAGQHLKEYDLEGFEIVKEFTFRWTTQLAQAPTVSRLQMRNSVVPVELLNILVSLQQFSVDGELAGELMETANLKQGEDWYFQVVVIIYICGRHGALQGHKEQVFKRARERLLAASELSRDSELTHLLLDLLACPFIVKNKRVKLLRDVWGVLKRDHNDLGNMTIKLAGQVVSEIQSKHWFVRWEGFDLLNMIEKKELSSVYA